MTKYNENGSIDLEYDHPQYGLIPFTASPNDVEELGRELYQRALDGEFGEIDKYVEPTPTSEQLAEKAKAEAQAYLLSTDWVEPYLIKHYIGIELLPLDSNKFLIEQKRKEAKELLR